MKQNLLPPLIKKKYDTVAFQKFLEITIILLLLVRLFILNFTKIPDVLGQRFEVSTPITSYKKLKEGLYLFQHGLDPYEGGLYTQAPLLLFLYHILSYLPKIFESLMYTACDGLIAYYVYCISLYRKQNQLSLYWVKSAPENKFSTDTENAVIDSDNDSEQELNTSLLKSGVKKNTKLFKDISSQRPVDILLNPLLVVVIYLVNPFTILSCLSKSTTIFNNLTYVLAIHFAIKKNINLSMFFTALSSYLSFYSFVIIAPCLLFLIENKNDNFQKKKIVVKALSLFVFYVVSLLSISYLMLDSFKFLKSFYGVILSISDLTPNIGHYWYFFTEIFEHFRIFFLWVFQLHIMIFIVPSILKFKEQPLFLTLVISSLISQLKTYPSIGDVSLYMIFIPMYQELYKYMTYPFFTCQFFLYSISFEPLMYNLWIWQGTGNANFLFIINLIFNIAQILLLTDTIHAFLKREHERHYPEFRGKELAWK
ncbi:PIG-U-domain-containing protein [Anaeromyces robustus]|uniref:PIG-U-domain-containing protein n=1 Tax=Anaeromyces robustus TaxID=1754192 RepID=A0A1Y1WXC1_9FUNG|nr:PIG-U-domain-containing protein [Anaeromyces robustus]|eukprot:ORX77774.1 PIG-U-domain-containing protein [Anaeromyces robustus]